MKMARGQLNQPPPPLSLFKRISISYSSSHSEPSFVSS